MQFRAVALAGAPVIELAVHGGREVDMGRSCGADGAFVRVPFVDLAVHGGWEVDMGRLGIAVAH